MKTTRYHITYLIWCGLCAAVASCASQGVHQEPLRITISVATLALIVIMQFVFIHHLARYVRPLDPTTAKMIEDSLYERWHFRQGKIGFQYFKKRSLSEEVQDAIDEWKLFTFTSIATFFLVVLLVVLW